MMRFTRTASSVVAVAVLLVIAFALIAPPIARAIDPLDPDYLINGGGASGSGSTAAKNKAVTTEAVKKEATATAAAATTTGGGGGTSGPALLPAATPVIVDSYSTDPLLLQAGSRFTLSITLKNPGSDSAEDVVVKIGPTTYSNWGANDDFVVLGGGSAQYVGTLDAGASNNSPTFQLMANPTAPGGVRSIPVTITWKSQGYEHTSSEVVGVLVNSLVSLDTTIGATGTQFQKKPFGVVLTVKNTATKTVKNLMVSFSGSGARPSSATSITVGDLAPGAVKKIPMKFTAPLVGRAKLMVTVSYADDFGDRRSVQAQGWARVQRTPPPVDTTDQGPSITDQLVAFAAALFGLNG